LRALGVNSETFGVGASKWLKAPNVERLHCMSRVRRQNNKQYTVVQKVFDKVVSYVAAMAVKDEETPGSALPRLK
jgi:hypothetical protein